ncbi:MAG: sulfur carrier protein ThiS [Planctomycetaceae bacterium]
MAAIAIRLNGEPRTVSSGTTVAALLAELGKTSRAVAVERNETVVPRARHAECVLEPGDRVEIVTLVGGG